MKWLLTQISLALYSIYTAYKKHQARQAHKLTGRQYHVVPSTKSRLKVVNNDFVNYYNQVAKKTGHKKITIYDLLKMSVYTVGGNMPTSYYKIKGKYNYFFFIISTYLPQSGYLIPASLHINSTNISRKAIE